MKKRIAIFASGSGTNAEEFFKRFQEHDQIEVGLLLSNKQDAYVLQRAKKYNIPSVVFTKKELTNGQVLKQLVDQNIDFIVLAGFLLLIPIEFVENFPNRIVNIHPALLPKYGGKGMYGDRVHKKVMENNESSSGITIHYVNENYDDGDIIFQSTVEIEAADNPETLAGKIHQLEHKYYPAVVEELIAKEM